MNLHTFKQFIITLLFVLPYTCFTQFVFAATEYEYQQEYSTNPVENTVWVREMPSSNSRLIALINKTDTVTVWAENGIYKKVTLTSGSRKGLRGYIESSDLRPQGYANKPTTNSSNGFTNIHDYQAVVTASRLRVRSGPGTGYRIYSRRLELNETVKVTHNKKGSSWVRISYQGDLPAYVSGSYLRRKLSTDGATDNLLGFRNTTDYKAAVTATKLRIRSGPGTDYRIYTRRLVYNETVNVTHTKPGSVWVRIEFRDKLPAFVSGDFLRRIVSTNNSTGNKPNTNCAKSGENIEIYKGIASEDGVLVSGPDCLQSAGNIALGDHVVVTKQSGQWVHVRIEATNRSGWIKESRLNRLPAPPASSRPGTDRSDTLKGVACFIFEVAGLFPPTSISKFSVASQIVTTSGGTAFCPTRDNNVITCRPEMGLSTGCGILMTHPPYRKNVLAWIDNPAKSVNRARYAEYGNSVQALDIAWLNCAFIAAVKGPDHWSLGMNHAGCVTTNTNRPFGE